MAATDTLASFIASLSENDRRLLAAFLAEQHAELFAARSEEARVRIAHECIREVHERLRASRKG